MAAKRQIKSHQQRNGNHTTMKRAVTIFEKLNLLFKSLYFGEGFRIRCLLLLFTIHYSLFTANGQLNDAQWMLGSNTSNIDFRGATPVNDTISKDMWTRFNNAALSDEQGNLQYYTNGIFIAGKLSNGDSILNGNGLSPCAFTTQYSNQGLPIPQASIFLNKPGSDRYYYLFHFSADNAVCYTLYYSIIDRQANFGLGAVIAKNDTFYQGITRTGGMAACKHANGRDWWIVIGGRNNNLYRKFLLTPNGISDTLLQYIGPYYNGPADNSYSRFSLDETRYVTGAIGGKITVMDFDRCNGEFSNPIIISNKNPPATGSGGMAEFSPNGRFIYVSDRLYLNQYDLTSANPQDSVRVFSCGCTDGAQLNQFSIATDGRIYGSTWAGGFQFLHVINNPDELGLNCNFVYGGQPTLSDNSINVSNTANPRLGALIGSGCDTIITGISPRPKGEGAEVRIQPNPADKAFYIEMPQQGNYVFDLINEQGQTVERRETHQVDIINVQGVESGVYFLSVKYADSNKKITTQKVIVQH